jgi:hypothetical protein
MYICPSSINFCEASLDKQLSSELPIPGAVRNGVRTVHQIFTRYKFETISSFLKHLEKPISTLWVDFSKGLRDTIPRSFREALSCYLQCGCERKHFRISMYTGCKRGAMSFIPTDSRFDGSLNDPRNEVVFGFAASAGHRGYNQRFTYAVITLLEHWLGLKVYAELPKEDEYPRSYQEARSLFTTACRRSNFKGLPGQAQTWYKDVIAQN